MGMRRKIIRKERTKNTRGSHEEQGTERNS